MRLTLEVISNAPQGVTPLKDRIIYFRGKKISVLENLGATKDHFDVLDFCDNDVIKLDHLAPLKRLKTLLLANNRISRIADAFGECVPNLESLVLSNNRLECLSDLRSLSSCKKLVRLSLLDNPVTNAQYYRSFLIFTIPSLRFIDFQRVLDKERVAAKEAFGSESEADLLAKIAAPRGTVVKRTDVSEESVAGDAEVSNGKISSEEIERIRIAIAQATTEEEVARLESALKSGVVPADILAQMASADAQTEPPEDAEITSALISPPPPPPPPAVFIAPQFPIGGAGFPPPPPPPPVLPVLMHTMMSPERPPEMFIDAESVVPGVAMEEESEQVPPQEQQIPPPPPVEGVVIESVDEDVSMDEDN